VLTIGPFSRIAGVSPKVLRTYDGLGLFRPVWLERGSGYRYYSPAQLPEIRRILALRDLGIGLAEIAGLVDGGTDLRQRSPGDGRARAERREVDRRLAALDIRVASDAADGGSATSSSGDRGRARRDDPDRSANRDDRARVQRARGPRPRPRRRARPPGSSRSAQPRPMSTCRCPGPSRRRT
jgi:DNA-binding transcriptional MerR regulator